MTRALTVLSACTLALALSDRVDAASTAAPNTTSKTGVKSKPRRGKKRVVAKGGKRNSPKKKSLRASGPGVSKKKKNGMTLIRPAGYKLAESPLGGPSEIKSETKGTGQLQRPKAKPVEELIVRKKVELTARHPASGPVTLNGWNGSWVTRQSAVVFDGGPKQAALIHVESAPSAAALQFRCKGYFSDTMTVRAGHESFQLPLFKPTHEAEFSNVDQTLSFIIEFGEQHNAPYLVSLSAPSETYWGLSSCDVERI